MEQNELFFGGSIPVADWQRFLDEEVTLRFPDGFTVIETHGQWRNRDGVISRENGHDLLIVTAPGAERLNQIRDAYKRRFAQESVLLVEQSVCAAF